MTDQLPARLLATPQPPRMSAALKLQVDTLRDGGSYIPPSYSGDTGLVLASERPVFDPDAAVALRSMEQLCGPPDRWLIEAWLNRLSAGMKRPVSGAEIQLRTAAVCVACSGVPLGAWSHETVVEALRKFDWFPSAAEVFRLLEPHAKRILGERDALARIVEADPERPRAVVSEPTEDEKAAVAEIVQKFHRERSFAQDNLMPRMRMIRPKRSQDVALLSMYRKLAAGPDKSAAASVRVNMLERKLGIAEDMP